MTRSSPSTPQLGFGFEPPQPTRRVWPVRELVSYFRNLIEKQLGDVWVEGEISNLRPAPSGHIYFTLKDDSAQLPVVLFRRQAMLLRFRPEDGLRVLVRGQVSIYEQRGQMQLVADTMEPAGIGSLQLAFEQLKERLKAEGLFDEERKQPLPAFPRTVGIITSPTGAVIHDFLNIITRRYSGLNVLLYPVSVQGDSAVAEIEAALAQLNQSALVDLIVLARGGGSLEDLAAFNSERVARAIAASQLPVISAIGHETDFTIADFVSDLRAPTPSAAAELVTSAQYRIAEHLETLAERLIRAERLMCLQKRRDLGSLSVSRAESRVITLVHRLQQRLDDLTLRLSSAIHEKLHLNQRRIESRLSTILRLSPQRQLHQGRSQLITTSTQLIYTMDRKLRSSSTRVQALDARLQSLSPLAVLERGYALVLNEEGKLIRSSKQILPGSTLTTHLSSGSFSSRVETITNNSPIKK